MKGKNDYGLKIGLGLMAVIVLVVLEVIFGFISGASGLIPLGDYLDPTTQLLAVMGILTIFVFTVFYYIKKSYMK